MIPLSVNPQLHTFRSPTYKSVVDKAICFLQGTPVHSLPPGCGFPGTGVYALYYTGDFEPYQKISVSNQEAYVQPIYVGKAVPSGWRAGKRSSNHLTQPLYIRLREHQKSIQQGQGLDIADFMCRFMILGGIETDLISSVEARLIRKFDPLWNIMIDGFGNHDPGSGRHDQARSEWDVLHPGRSWADKLKGAEPLLQDILKKIQQSS